MWLRWFAAFSVLFCQSVFARFRKSPNKKRFQASQDKFWTSSAKFTRAGAKRYCAREGGRLASIDNTKLAQELLGVVSNLDQLNGWIGSFKGSSDASFLFKVSDGDSYKVVESDSDSIKAYAFCEDVWDSPEWFYTSSELLTFKDAVAYCKSKNGSIARARSLEHLRHVKRALVRREQTDDGGWFRTKTNRLGFFLDLRNRGKPRVSRAGTNDKHYAVCQDNGWNDSANLDDLNNPDLASDSLSIDKPIDGYIDPSSGLDFVDNDVSRDSETIRKERDSETVLDDSLAAIQDSDDINNDSEKDSITKNSDSDASTFGTWDRSQATDAGSGALPSEKHDKKRRGKKSEKKKRKAKRHRRHQKKKKARKARKASTSSNSDSDSDS